MKMKSKWLIALMTLIMAFSMTACGGGEEPATEPAEDPAAEAEIVVPDEIATLRAKLEGNVADYAQKLTDDGWGDKYVALLASGKAREYADYEAIKQVLGDINEELGATYTYALTPLVDEEITYDVEETNEVPFAITVDPCEDPDDWGEPYDWEIQFTEAWEGAAASARSAWDDSEEGDGSYLCWSAFAPVKDSEGNTVCILGIDYPCVDIVKDFPEWNRDGEAYNHYEGE